MRATEVERLVALLTEIADTLLPVMDLVARLSEVVALEMAVADDPEAALAQSGLLRVWEQLDRIGIPPP